MDTMPRSTTATALPHTLLMLLHLHLLEFEPKEGITYDARLFDSKCNGTRERMKAMEDISFFLITRLEGGRDRAKKILATYPCAQPADSTAFRISLVKYLEVLRHNILVANNSDATRITSQSETLPILWWKDVLVRKSILEECSGERFEKLLLALSTQTLYKLLSRSSDALEESGADAPLRPSASYAALLAKAQAERKAWERTSSSLLHRGAELQSLRNRLTLGTTSSRYDSLSTEKLVALCESTRKDLLRPELKIEEGEKALDFLLECAGLRTSLSPDDTHKAMNHPRDGVISSTLGVSVQPLPTAAAHYPAHLAALKAPLFAPASHSTVAEPTDEDTTQSNVIPLTIQERLDSTAQVAESLGRALAETETLRQQLQQRLQSIARPVIPDDPIIGLDLRSWSSGTRKLDFSKSAVVDSAFTGSSEGSSRTAALLENKIAHIRANILPQYPPMPSPYRLFSESDPVPKQSRLPQPAACSQTIGRNIRQAQGGQQQSQPERRPTAIKAALTQAFQQGTPTLMATAGTTRRTSAARARRSLAARTSMDNEIVKIIEAVCEGASFEIGKTATRG